MKNILIFLLAFYCGNEIKAQINTTLNFEEKVHNLINENNVPCVGICIIENGELSYAKVFGELQKSNPAPKNAIFNIASITKPVVAIVTLKLIESGSWDLDVPLDKYWIDPDLLNDTLLEKLTTRHVLSHQSGFPNWRAGQKLKFEFEPGTQYQYSGEGFEYLRKSLEKKFNKSLAAISDSILFNPLGMNSTWYFWNDSIKKTRFAFGHDSDGNIYEGQDWGYSNAAASLLTTIEDFSKFMVHVMNGAGLSKELFNEMVKSQVNVKKHISKGLGWGIISDLSNEEYALEHGGSNPGFQSMAILLPESEKGIAVFTNGDNGMFVYNNIIAESIDLGHEILGIMNNSYNAPVINLSNEILDKYVGTYSRSDVEGYLLHIKREGNDIIISGDGVPSVKLLAEAENKFFIKDFGFQYEFVTDENNKVLNLKISEQGKLLLDAKKIE